MIPRPENPFEVHKQRISKKRDHIERKYGIMYLMEIVFVHLNTPLPKYLMHNMKHCAAIFPDVSVVLLHNAPVSVAEIPKVKTVLVEPDIRWEELNDLYSHPKEFRGNFWFTSSARLFALQFYMETTNREFVHLESDVIVSRDFPFHIFKQIKRPLAFPIISNERGVGSVIYVRDQQAAEILTSTLVSEAKLNSQVTEMICLRKVFDLNRNSVQLLPIGPIHAAAYRNIDEEILIELLNAHEKFGGVFDGVEIGQFFGGTDPRNRRGAMLLRNDLVNGYAKIKDWKLNFDFKRNFANVKFKNQQTESKVYALHMPCKDTRFFKSRTQSHRIKQMCSKAESEATSRIIVFSLIKAIFNSLVRRLRTKVL